MAVAKEVREGYSYCKGYHAGVSKGRDAERADSERSKGTDDRTNKREEVRQNAADTIGCYFYLKMEVTMETERKKLSQEQIADAVSKLKRNGTLDNQILELVRSDYQYGLLTEEIEIYLKRKFNFSQKQMISKALREYGVELANVIAREDLDEQAMQMAIEFYGQGVPLEVIVQSVEEQTTAYSLRRIYKDVLLEIKETEAELNEAEDEDEEGIDKEFVEQMIGEMKAIALTINHDSKRYDALTEKLQEISVSKKAEEELAEREEQVERLQGEIAVLNHTNDRLRKALSEKEEERKALERKLQESMQEQPRAQVQYMTGYPQGTVRHPNRIMAVPGTMGHPQGVVYVEKTKPKKNGLSNLFGKAEAKRQPKQDITKLVASGQLNTEQLAQVKVAISRGLTDEQLCDLIQGNVSAEQMKEIIEIAVLENSMR